jgi:biotin transport system substrate-specific component
MKTYKEINTQKASLIIQNLSNSKPLLLASLIGLSWFYALCEQICIPLPFNPVPVCLQPMSLFLCCLVLGWHAVFAYGLYLLQGAAGLPFFAGMQGGLMRLCGPTGGYLFGFGLAAIVLASLRNYHAKSYVITFIKLLGALIIYFSCGLLQLAWFVPVEKLLACGLYPFIVGDVLKMIGVTTIMQMVKNSKK